MAEPRYSIPVEELVAGARVPAAEQVEIQPEPREPATDWSTGLIPCADGMGGDADGD